MGSELVIAAGVLLIGSVIVVAAWRRLSRSFDCGGTARRIPVDDREYGFRTAIFHRCPPVQSRYSWLPWLIGIAVGLTLLLVFRPRPAYYVVPALVVSLLGNELDKMRVGRRTNRIEAQLADAIDIMVGALQAGAGATADSKRHYGKRAGPYSRNSPKSSVASDWATNHRPFSTTSLAVCR